ncbi:nuclear factor related to kappa-B-binding protein [Sitodiplosis mosellana]|uniref:nuclear factor related to kappa-B-binding protein n=1 Tax=Sitodiplosis mosellana TaxID=263140 RepID=UPI00244466E7|nr:nuclear factor related to kappa-B-binding protein [Sitodiplosis mosellana]XP_055295017.1 nuclear factor related to kappa-B-binding protein [Sitodiplosis mosellana]XP_055295025.1 nuclear factor related to kappa-B-binding protein [Sitodiplosis mosellana]XP_055295033.1 nuclear factor related to kappa-B-binding protein [Sitodiplosis mosellana]XP_055295041.1 nuclear factor related to kappa-B-binding protein [Sitodiplosis mosellana]XP_055295050.1 nuclear factor related to kappa-B-binding protein 
MMAHSANMMIDNMSDSDSSDSSESGTSSSASSNSSESEQSSQSLEPARILKQNLELPKGLCENLSIFNEFFSLDTWRCLPDHMKDQLKPLLPNFSGVCDNDKKEIQRETNATVQKLFTNQITRFESSPLIDFQRNLEEGNYRPDISRLRANIKKSQRREQRFQNCERISQLAKSLTVSCEQQLRHAYDGMAIETVNRNKKKKSPNKLVANAAAIRSKKRYFEEIAKIREEVGLDSDLSDDDNYPDGLAKKPKRNVGNNQVGLNTGSEPRIISTMASKSSIQSSNQQSLVGNPDAEEILRELLLQHKTRKQEDPEHIELDTSEIKISDIYARTYNTPGRKPTVKVPINTDFDVNQIKIEPDLKIDHMETDLLPPVSSSFDIPSMDTSHISLSSQFVGLPRNNSFLDKISTISPTMSMKDSLGDIGQLKPEIKEEKLEADVCKQFLKDDDFKPNRSIESLDTKNRSGVMFSSAGNKDKKKQVYDVLIGNPSSKPSLYVKDENLNASSIDPKFNENILPLVSSITTPTISCSMSSDMKIDKSPGDKLLKNNSSLTFSDKSLKADSFSDLDGIDIMRLPVDLGEPGNIDILDHIVADMKPDLLQETHACFLSLIRDIFCSTPDHRITLESLHGKISAWVANPITALNDWYGLADSWLDLLQSAVYFLAGEFVDQPDDFVPYIEYKSNLNIYQWIGAGRDRDQHLKQLCEYWLTRRNEMGIKPHSKVETEIFRSKPNNIVSIEETRANASDRAVSPPPLPRCPTNWIVQKASAEEILEFREQERRRFEHPDRAFTYRMHGFESVVGPVKGIYTQIPAMTKARGHTMLTTDRPSFVTILTLVRDATARLPNGEGTRADICELLKSSQYLCPSASETVLQTIVSGALDRMHTENDPCVRYDSKRKIWIYLHRNRTEEEFEIMHQQFQGLSKHKKQNTRKSKVKNSTPKTPDSNLAENNPPAECSELLINSPSAPLSNAAIPIGTTPKKKVTIKTIPAQGIVAISGATHHAPTNAQPTIPATVKLTQPPVIISSMSSLPVPALSSINSPTLTTNPPPLINKVITTQKKTIIKPELVPIQQMNEAKVEAMDIETTLENAPIIISKSPTVQNQQAQITGIIIDKNQKINTKIIGKPTIGIVSAAPSSAAQIKVSTAGGIQTVHVSPGHTLIKSQQGQNALLQTTGGNQSILTANQMRRSQHTKALPPLVAAQSPSNHSYVIPISIGKSVANVNKTFQPVVAQTTTKSISPKTIKTSTVPISATSNSLQRTSLPQIVTVSGNKTIIRTAANTVPAGKSLINPSVVAANRQQQTTMQIIQAKSLSQQNIIVSPSGANVIGGNQKATIVGTSSPIMVQKLIAVSKTGTPTSNVMVTSSPSICNVNTIGTTTTPPGTSLINPQIIQIHQTNQDKAPTTAKVQTISTANLSPMQQQSLLQSINKQIRVQGIQQSGTGQQNLIIKPQQVLTQIQKQIQLAPVQTSSSLIDAQIQLVSTASASNTQPIISRAAVKSTTSLIQTSSTTSPVTSVRTISANSPLIGKMITDQFISLENLVQQNKVNMSSVRIATAKPGQTTNLIQLTGTPGSQMTQYAVVSIPQPRLVTTPAANTNASTISGQVVSVSGVKTSSGVSGLSNVSSSASKPEIVKISGKNTMISHPTIIQSQQSGAVTPKIVQSAQLQPITAQQLINAKVLGVQGFQGISPATQLNQRVKAGSIRMVNASNLNIANIDGKSIIIAKAPTQMIQSPGQISKSSLWTQQGNNVGKANIISTLPAGSQIQGSQVMFGNQIVKIQPQQSIASVQSGNSSTPTMSVINLNANSANSTGTTATASVSNVVTGSRTGQTVVLGSTGQAIKVHAPTMMTTTAGDKPTFKNIIKGAAPGQRVVLAVQGGSQFILPQNFQGGTINLKSLQGLKMIPIQQTTQIQSNINSQITGNQSIKPPNSATGDS